MDPKLWAAATFGDAKFIEEVIQTCKTRLLEVTIDGNSALHIAAKRGNEEIARKVIEAQPSLLPLPNNSGDTPLHLASAAGHSKIVTLLIHQHEQLWQHYRPSSGGVEEDVVWMATIANRIGNTALHAAIMYTRASARGPSEVVNLLLSAAPKLATMTNQAGVSPLYMAAEREQLWIVRRILMESTEVSHQGPRDQTALHAAVLRSYEISKMILDKNPSCLKHQDTSKSTPLHFAAASGNVDILRLLLERDASAGYMQDEEGFAIIHIAAKGGGAYNFTRASGPEHNQSISRKPQLLAKYPASVNLNMIKAILEHCPDAVEQKNNKGSNFVHVAVEKKNLKVVEYVITSSPSAKELLNEQDHEGNTPLHLAVLMKDVDMMIELLLSSQNADPALTNNSGFTPIDLAFSAARKEISPRMCYIMEKLMECGSRFSPQRVDHIRTPFQIMQDEINGDVNDPRTYSQRKQDGIGLFRRFADNLTIVAVLIATVTFAAAFTLPGGYKNDSGSDEGMAILSSRAAFKAFLISDTFAMVCSVLTAVALIQFDPTGFLQGIGDEGLLRLRLRWPILLLVSAVVSLCVAFATGVYSVIPPDSQWVAILVIIIVCPCNYFALFFLGKGHIMNLFT